MDIFSKYFKSPDKSFLNSKNKAFLRVSFILFLTTLFLKTYTSLIFVNNDNIIKLANIFNLNKLSMIVISLLINLFILLLTVNIIYFLVSFLIKILEDIQFNNKNVKNLIYISYLVPFTLTNIFQLIFMLVTHKYISIKLMSIVSCFAYLGLSFLIFFILKVYIKTKTLHKYIPIIIFLINIFFSIKHLV